LLQAPGTTLAPEQLSRALTALSRASVTYLTFGDAAVPPGVYDAVLEIHADGTWHCRPSAGLPR
jgi:hypothetical protein